MVTTDTLNLYLTQPPDSLDDADLQALHLAPNRTGGFVTAPVEFVRELARLVGEMGWIRRFATPHILPAAHSHSVTKQVKISKKLFEKGKIRAYELVADRLAYWFSQAETKEFLIGTGLGEPLGLFTPSTAGISTHRDFSSASASSLTEDDFEGAIRALAPQHRANARWILHPAIVNVAAKLIRSDGTPLYENPGKPLYRQNVPSPTIAGMPYIMFDDAPAVIATGRYIAVLGDLRLYGVSEITEFEIEAVVEAVQAGSKNAYAGRMLIGGMPLLAEAFARLKMA